MRKLTGIRSERIINSKGEPFKIIFEWEDVISKEMNLSICPVSKIEQRIESAIQKLNLTKLYHRFLPPKNLRLAFFMRGTTDEMCRNNKNTIPVIIDFWLKESELPSFYKAYKEVPLMLITNKEVFELLKDNNCPINIAHWPLSLPDKYKQEGKFLEKEYELSVIGRPNPFFLRFLDKYCEKNPDFEYVMGHGNHDNRIFVTNKGKFIMKDTGRDSYINIIKKTRISCYTTPGYDESKTITNRYNQVTPRLLEMLSNDCLVIGHYPNTADTKWYNLNSVVPNVDTFEEFEQCLNKMREDNSELYKIRQFMLQHYTSTRIRLLEDILNQMEFN